jgi:hypothetical protein
MAAVELIVGAIMVAASLFAFWIALPTDGQVRPFLSNEHVQAYYAIAIIGAFFYGAVNVFMGIKDLL